MDRIRVQVDRGGCLSATVAVFPLEFQRRYPMIAQSAEEERAALHRSRRVISHVPIVATFVPIETANNHYLRSEKGIWAHFSAS
jgi:hypothetical protein